MSIYRRSLNIVLIATLAFLPMMSLVSTPASAADVPACHKDGQNIMAENINSSAKMNHGANQSDMSDCSSTCGSCFTCLKLPVSKVTLDGPYIQISTYILTPTTTFNNISPQQEPRPPRLV